MRDTAPLRDAYRSLLDAAATVAQSGDPDPIPPAGERNADRLMPLRDLFAGLAAAELPAHTQQILALLPAVAL